MPDDSPIKIAGYTTHKKNTLNNRADGTAIAVRKNIEHKLLDSFVSDLLAIEVSTSTGKLIIATLYQPPARNFIPTPDFIKLFRRHTPVYMIADLNANHPLLGYQHINTKGRQIHKLIQNRTIQHTGPDFPTFYTQGRGTTPDIILTNYRTYHNTHATPGPLTTSDHIPIIFTISTSPILIPVTPRPDFRKADWDKFQNHINNNLQNNNLNNEIIETIDEAVDNWHQTIHDATQQFIPITHYKPLPAPKHTDTTTLLMTLFSELQAYTKERGWTIQHYRYYKNLQSVLQDSLIHENNENWAKLIKNVSNTYSNPTTFWEKIRLITGNSTAEPQYIKNTNNIKIYSNEGKEEIHRKYWEKVFDVEIEDDNTTEKVLEHLQHNLHRTTPYDNTDQSRLNTGNTDTVITEDEVKNIIKKLKKTSPGKSGINKVILTHLPDNAITRLTNIYNNTLSAGYFPDRWKQAILRLIPKVGKSPHAPQNYRPISLLEVPGKILERIINSRLKNYLENNMYNPNQFGFRNHRGTTHALAIVTEKIAQLKGDRGQCQVMLRDVTKAFDQVWHCGLIYKIQQLQLPTLIEKFLSDFFFLSDRTASVKIKKII